MEKHEASRTTLPAAFYVDPNYFRKEIEFLFLDSWVCAGRSSQIPDAGDFFVRELLDENVIVVKDEKGLPRALHNVCRHRGTRLCADVSGKFTGRIQCPYHAWTYDLEGKLVGAPHMTDSSQFRAEDYPLKSARCETWDGHLFVSFSDKPRTSLDAHLGALRNKFRPWAMEDLRLGQRIVYDVKANWKLIVQNYSECLHCPVIHPALQKLSHYLSGENEPASPTFLGGSMGLKEGVETLSMDGKRRRSLFPGLGHEERRIVEYYWIAPNFLLSLHPDFMLTHTLWPKAPGRTEVVCEWHFHKDEIDKAGFVHHDAVEFWDVTNRQDWHVSELSQSGIASRAYSPGPYSKREGLLFELDQIIQAAARAGGYLPTTNSRP